MSVERRTVAYQLWPRHALYRAIELRTRRAAEAGHPHLSAAQLLQLASFTQYQLARQLASMDPGTGAIMTTSQFPENPITYSYVPDYSMDAPDGHSWVRPVVDCPDCPCCTKALCAKARAEQTSCWNEGGGNKDGYHPLDKCPCCPLDKPSVGTLVETGN